MSYNQSMDIGPKAFATNINTEAKNNRNFRTALWTGEHLQMTLMSIPVCGDIGVEIHEDTDQYIRIEQGQALAKLGEQKDCLINEVYLHPGDGIFVPAGVWHNILNAGNCKLKLSSVYAPPHHPRGVIQENKEEY